MIFAICDRFLMPRRIAVLSFFVRVIRREEETSWKPNRVKTNIFEKISEKFPQDANAETKKKNGETLVVCNTHRFHTGVKKLQNNRLEKYFQPLEGWRVSSDKKKRET